MNRARAATARAKMHEALDELFDAIEERATYAPPPEKSEPRRKVTDVDKARARKALRKLGLET